MKNLSTNKAIAMLWLFMIFFGGCIFSCNPVNRVNKSPERQLKVIKNYAANHGFRNDTVRVVKKGDSVVVERTDTVTNVVTVKDSDTVTIYKHIYNTRPVSSQLWDFPLLYHFWLVHLQLTGRYNTIQHTPLSDQG